MNHITLHIAVQYNELTFNGSTPKHLTNIELPAVQLRTGTKGEYSLQLAKKILYPDSFK